MKKLQIGLSLLVLLSTKSSAELYDVTTIYRLQEGPRNETITEATLRSWHAFNMDRDYSRVHSQQGSLEIHARTNALGLPFLIDSDNIIISGPTVGIEFPECYPHITSGCENWFKFKWENTPQPEIPSLWSIGSSSTMWTSGSNLTAVRRYNENGIKIIFQPGKIDGTLKIFLLDRKSNFKTSDMYYLQIPNRGYFASEASILKCTQYSQGKGWYIPGEDMDRDCLAVKTSKNDFYYWNTQQEYTIHVSIVEHTIKVSIHYDACSIGNCINRKDDLLIWKDNNPIDVKYYAAATLYMEGKFKLENVVGFLSLSDKEGALMSPEFTPNSRKLCISVEYYLSPVNGNSLRLYVLLEDENEFELENMEKSDEWQVKRYIKELPSYVTLENIKLVLRGRKSMNSNVLVHRLASCNAESEEDILVFPDDYPLVMRKPGYDVAVHHVKSGDPVTRRSCKHGGKFDEDAGKCICPAGFVGETCEKGCGPNSYGDDCGGRCSWSKRGCKEMILCRPKLGCSCAPGFTGYICNVPCNAGKYGPDCGYECGRCKNTVCNPYTGTCPQGCILGYRPPACNETYTYVTTSPQFLSGYNWLVGKAKIADNLNGSGRPLFYQFQYKEGNKSEAWIGKDPEFLRYDVQQVSVNLTGLEVGRTYQVRLILIDEDGNSYQGSQIPYSTIETLCDVPNTVPVDLHAANISATGFIITWEFKPESDKWCPITKFEVQVKDDWHWVSYSNKTDSSALITDLLPGMTYKIRVRGHIPKGVTKFSETLSVTTGDDAPSEVMDLMVISTSSDGLHLTWKEPRFTAGNIKHYIISYECLRLLGCHKESCSESSGQLEALNTSAILNKLKSNAVYKIVVAGVSGTNGSSAEILAVTDQAPPSVSPEMSSITCNRTNSSLTVHWKPPTKCTYYNGYALGYYYELMEENKSSDRILFNGNTTVHQTTFSGLRAFTQYLVKVYLLTTKGWNEEFPLVVPVETLANAPDMVQNLTVYKRSRKMLGLRWAAPKQTYGPLESFTVSYYLEGVSKSEAVHKTIKPDPCFAWNNYYCHSLYSLQSERKYIVTVQARNSKVELDGEAVSISSITEEGAPGHPDFLKLTERENTSISLEWGIPMYLNGILRSFIISIEETESHNYADCCQYFPVQEIIPNMEKNSYTFEISGLKPASTYIVSVSAKTVIIGPSVNVTTHTLPPTPEIDAPLILDPVKANESFSISVKPSTSYEGLISGYILLILPLASKGQSDITIPQTKIWNTTFQLELQKIVNGDFYLAAEYEQSELEKNSNVYIGKGITEKVKGKWGELTDPHLSSGVIYRFGLVLVLEYYDARSIGYVQSEDFTVMSELNTNELEDHFYNN